MVGWAGYTMRMWAKDMIELKYRWRLEGVTEYPKTPHPASTSVVRRLYHNNAWQYIPVATPEQLSSRVKWIAASVFLTLFFLAVSVFANWAIVFQILGRIETIPELYNNWGNVNLQARNALGTMALYGTTGLIAFWTFVWNSVYTSVATWLTYKQVYIYIYIKYET